MPELAWQKSSFSAGGNQPDCIEIATSGSLIHLRESDRPSEIVTARRRELAVLIDGIKAGELG